MNKIINCIKQIKNENPGRILEVRQLENTYREILKLYGYSIESHVSRFGGKVLKEKIPGKVLRNVRKKFTLYFKSTADASIDEFVN